MKIRFKTPDLERFYFTPANELKGKLPVQKDIIRQYQRKVRNLTFISSLEELKSFQCLNFEPLKGDLKGNYSIRLNKQYRLIFSIEKEVNGDYVIEVILISEISKHYEK
jgi:plasmid maintenance system killer protein